MANRYMATGPTGKTIVVIYWSQGLGIIYKKDLLKEILIIR